MHSPHVTRRGFLQATAAASLALAAGPVSRVAPGAEAPPEARKTRSYNQQMEYRRLGKTGLWVSAVCLGGHYNVGLMGCC